MKKHKVELGVALPKDSLECEACARRILDVLRRKEGILEAHVDRDASVPSLCLHYDPVAVRLEAVDAIVRAAGASVEKGYEHLVAPAVGLRHETQARLVEGVLARQPGVFFASVAFGTRRLFVEFDPEKTNRDTLLKIAAKAGVTSFRPSESPAAAAHEHDEHEHEHGPFGERSELVFSLTCGVLTAIGWRLQHVGVRPSFASGAFVIAYAFGGWFTIQEVLVALRARRFEIDFLMLLAAIGAAVLGDWFEGALLLFLFTLGHSLEGYAMRRARNAITALAKLVPETAIRVEESGEREVSVRELVGGDRIVVKPNTRIAADGFVSEGASSVNQSPVTGESVPVEKRAVEDATKALLDPDALDAEHKVFAGTINGTAALTVVVTKTSSESTLARVVELVEQAETHKSPTQQLTDRIERVFVPVILAVVVMLLFAWVVVDEPFSRSFYRAMAVLVAASPCALAIATPSAVLSGVARAARSGVLVKGGSHLESLGLVRAIAFDKTGTLTEGRPVLTNVVAAEGVSETELLRHAVAIERRSDHPLASSIVNGGLSRLDREDVPEASNVEAIVGFGIRGMVDGSEITIGKPKLFDEAGLPTDLKASVERLREQGRTVILVRKGEVYLGLLGVMDTPRPAAREVVAQLHELGIEETVMLSGDNQQVANAVAEQVGIRRAIGELLPEDKVRVIAELARSNKRVAMVGDGVNDAPAMANATVGIAMGAGGSDVALETADIALMADDLRALPFAVGLSRTARAIIRQNLIVSLGMVLVLVPATILGARIGTAVVLHEGSTLIVVANALRLLAYGRKSSNDLASSPPSVITTA